MDDFQARALGSLTKRHEARIRENAERIREHIGYVLQRIDAGRADATGLYARDIAASAQEIVTRVAALEAIGEAVGIFSSGD